MGNELTKTPLNEGISRSSSDSSESGSMSLMNKSGDEITACRASRAGFVCVGGFGPRLKFGELDIVAFGLAPPRIWLAGRHPFSSPSTAIDHVRLVCKPSKT